MLRVRDCMTTDVIVLRPATTVREAMEILASYHIGGAPVMDGDALVGIVSAADLLRFAASLPVPETETLVLERLTSAERAGEAEERDVPLAVLMDAEMDDDLALDLQLDQGRLAERDALDVHTVDEIMTSDVLTIGADEPAVAAADALRRDAIHRLPVLDGGTLAGIITTTDLARAVADRRLIARTFVFPRRAGG